MPYHLDEKNISLHSVRDRILASDVILSRRVLKDHINEMVERLEKAGMRTLLDYKKAVKTKTKMDDLVRQTGLDAEHINLLRREIDSYCPKACLMSDFGLLDEDHIARLIANGYQNTALLYDAFEDLEKRGQIARSIGLSNDMADELFILAGLTRIQWVSPLFARALAAAGYTSAQRVARADANRLYQDIKVANLSGQYYKGTVGIKDMQRLIQAAAYLWEQDKKRT